MRDVDLTVVRIDPRPAGGLKAMLAEVATYYGYEPGDFMSTSRVQHLAHARQAFMWHARQVRWPDGRNRYSLPQIAAFLGGMDHTTVLYGERQHAKRLGVDRHKSLNNTLSSACESVAS